MSDDQKQLPPPPEDDDDEIEAAPTEVVPTAKQKRTAKEAQRGLDKFNKRFEVAMKASQFGGLAEFGQYLRGKGPTEIALGFAAYAAKEAQEGIRRCDELIDKVDDPELKVRLAEKKLDYIEATGKIAGEIAKMDRTPVESGQQINRPVMAIFAPNTIVGAQPIAAPPEKVIES